MGLADLRKKAKLTLHGLAKISGVNYQKIWQIEHDVIKPERIALRTAMRLAAALNCTPEDLLAPDEPEGAAPDGKDVAGESAPEDNAKEENAANGS